MSEKTLRTILQETTEKLKSAHVPDPRFDARALIMSAFNLDTAHFLLYEDKSPADICKKVSPDSGTWETAVRELEANVSRRAKREPLQQILGTAGFYGIEFKVTKDVLCPRADTETLIDAVLGNLTPDNISAVKQGQDEAAESVDAESISGYVGENDEASSDYVDRLISGRGIVDSEDATLLDMCTGSGCIAITLAKFGHFKEVTAVDISDAALKIATYNKDSILNQDEKDRFCLLKSDMFSEIHERYDVIVSNPPYIPSRVVDELEPEVRDYEPRIALDGTDDGLKFYRILAEEAPKHLKENGFVLFEIGYDQGDTVSTLLREAGFKGVIVIRDFGQNDRVVMGHL